MILRAIMKRRIVLFIICISFGGCTPDFSNIFSGEQDTWVYYSPIFVVQDSLTLNPINHASVKAINYSDSSLTNHLGRTHFAFSFDSPQGDVIYVDFHFMHASFLSKTVTAECVGPYGDSGEMSVFLMPK